MPTHSSTAAAPPPLLCSVSNCEKPAVAVGMCKAHRHKYLRATATTTCAVAQCDKPVNALGLCAMHYSRLRSHGSLELPPVLICSVSGCLRNAVARGWCKKHWKKWRLFGDPEGTSSREIPNHYVPGMTDTPTYSIWCGLIARCTNPKSPIWSYYGGRGITVCARWRGSFVAFLDDMGERPDGTELDRIDNARGYEKSNCRWTTRKQNMRNQRANRLVTWRGKTKCVAEWAELLGIAPGTLWARLFVLKWNVERSMTA